jgi:hypothetical protein
VAVNLDRWDVAALRAGASVSLVFAVPFQVLAAIFVDDGQGGLGALLFFGTAAGFVIGAGCAAWLQRVGAPLSHGIVAAVAPYAVVQLVFIVLALVIGDGVEPVAVAFTLTLTAFAGLIGGFLGGRMRARGVLPSIERSATGGER